MKLLLTSGGITNTSIRDALVDLLGKPIADSTALCIPDGSVGLPVRPDLGADLRHRTPLGSHDPLGGGRWASSS